jgi:hypothetical protein
MKKEPKTLHTDFESIEMDDVVHKWLSHGIPTDEKEIFEKTLLYNRRFREHFCEWLKAIREPAWSLSRQKEKGGEE